MKSTIFLLMLSLPFAVVAQKKPDTITLKNGQTISGYIYKMEDSRIFIAGQKDSAIYRADEVQTIMFCHDAGSNRNCPDIVPVKADNSNTASNNTQQNNYSVSNNDKEKGSVTFRCNMCGSKGNLAIEGGAAQSKVTYNHTFNLDNGNSFFQHTAELQPGEYRWSYADMNNNETKGKFTIGKGEQKKIVLFEKE
jgi:hypothetical protein